MFWFLCRKSLGLDGGHSRILISKSNILYSKLQLIHYSIYPCYIMMDGTNLKLYLNTMCSWLYSHWHSCLIETSCLKIFNPSVSMWELFAKLSLELPKDIWCPGSKLWVENVRKHNSFNNLGFYSNLWT